VPPGGGDVAALTPGLVFSPIGGDATALVRVGKIAGDGEAALLCILDPVVEKVLSS
jgi:hypothetical protein